MAEITVDQYNEGQPLMSTDWRFYLWWVLASTVGWAVGGPVGLAMSGSAAVALGVTVAAVLQWLVLRQQVAQAGKWMLASIVAVIVAGVAGFIVSGFLGVFGDVDVVAEAGTVGVVIGGTVLGVLQWLMVLKQRAKRAGWWVLASTSGWLVGGVVSGAVDPVVGLAVIGAVYGAITGLALLWLLRQRMTAASTDE